MATVTFDTRKFVERLTAAGMPLEQAEVEAEALADIERHLKRISINATLFDTLKFANRLKDAGVPPMQAEAGAEALAELETDLRIALDGLRFDLREDLEKDREYFLSLKDVISKAVADLGKYLYWQTGAYTAGIFVLIYFLK